MTFAIIMKSTKVQTLGAPMRMRSLGHNNYLLLGVVTQHVESRSIWRSNRRRKCAIGPLTLLEYVNDTITFE